MQEQTLNTDQNLQQLNQIVPETTLNPVPETTPVAVQQTSKQNFWQIAAIVLLFLLLATVGALVYFLQKNNKQVAMVKPTPTEQTSPLPPSSPLLASSQPTASATSDETTGWNTYTNTVYHYQISYPSQSQTVNISAGSKGSAALPNSTEFYITDPNDSEYVSRLMNISYLDSTPKMTDGEGNALPGTVTMIGGKPATKYSNAVDSPVSGFDIYETGKVGQPGIEIFVQKNSSLASQILSTFKFTN